MNFSLPIDALSLRGESFHRMVEQFCGKEVVELLQFQLIDNSMNLIETKNPFFILQFESDRTTTMKEALGISCTDEHGSYSFFVMPGVRLKLEKLVRSLNELIMPTTRSSSLLKSLTLSSKLIEKYSFLIDLIYCLESNLLTNFSIDFLSNWMSNIASSSKNSFRYTQSIKDFAASLYILGGPTLYEFLRLNIPGSIPNRTSVRSILSSSEHRFNEGEFRYSGFLELVHPLGCKYAFCGEDCTAIVPKVSYDYRSNSFVGFTLPLKNGFPRCQFYSTNSLDELELWHGEVEKSTLLNIQVIQALTPQGQIKLSPFLLAAYGTDNKYKANDILNRWSRIFDVLMSQGTRILGYSTDCDGKNLRAMRNSMAFFTNNQTIFLNHPNIFTISSMKTNSWFFLRPQQLFVCFQDGVHLCGNLRNRLLSEDVFLLIGNERASVDHLLELIDKQSKLDHGLVMSDIYVKDKQNSASCEKISSDTVINSLQQIPGSMATQVYIQIMRFVRMAYIEKSTDVISRLYYAWCAVFIVRIWFASLEKADPDDIEQKVSSLSLSKSTKPIARRNLFITMQGLFSLEINAHSLTYLLLLVAEKKITEESLRVIFNSQVCESYFRAARSMSGPFSSVVNFSVKEFLHRASKLSTLEDIKYASELNLNNLIFPKHHKLWKQTGPSLFTSTIPSVTDKVIEDTVFSSYIAASQILASCNLSILNPSDEMISFDEVNRLAFQKLARSKENVSTSQSFQWTNDDQESDDDDDKEDESNASKRSYVPSHINHHTDDDDSLTDIDETDSSVIQNVAGSTVHGMRIFDSIDNSQSNSFFRVKINNQEKFMHKQTATWYLSKNNVKLSSDRVKRVQSQK